MAETFTTIDEYIASFPEDVRLVLQSVRESIHRAAPGGTEKIKYGMPAVEYGGRHAVYFAGWKRHLALYPLYPTDDEAFEREVAPYRAAKDSLHFFYAKPMPYDLIERIAARIAR